MNKTLVCPIAFNENIKLKNAVERFLSCSYGDQFDYLVIDDCSIDGTQDMLRSFKEQGVETICHEVRKGVGAGIRTAIRHAQQKGYEIIVIMAGNDKDNPQEIPCLIDPIRQKGCDLVQGSRYVGGKRIGGDMPLYRKIATKMHPLLFAFFTKTKVTDSTNGFRAIKLSLFNDERINLDQEWLDNYELEPYILFKAITLGYFFKEAAVTKIYPKKKLGYTKMKPIIGWWSILRPIFYLGLGIRK
ncbi:MAG: glycosyltransferase family 2 protein [Candidatus Omnitrophica bacterium]|nr:glycosyltransferase family 2 protein [Candidatus Omnitrophota bacterium]